METRVTKSDWGDPGGKARRLEECRDEGGCCTLISNTTCSILHLTPARSHLLPLDTLALIRPQYSISVLWDLSYVWKFRRGTLQESLGWLGCGVYMPVSGVRYNSRPTLRACFTLGQEVPWSGCMLVTG